LTKFIEKKKHVGLETNLIRYIIVYIFIIYLFDVVDVNILFYKLARTLGLTKDSPMGRRGFTPEEISNVKETSQERLSH
jgi:hypothetical protein